MKKLSVARKFKMITSQDIMRVSKLLEKKEKDENCNDVSDTIEFIEYGLYLAFYEADLAKAKMAVLFRYCFFYSQNKEKYNEIKGCD